MTRVNYLALIAMNLLGTIFMYKRLHSDDDTGFMAVMMPVMVAVAAFNIPAIVISGIDYLLNKKFNARMFNSIIYFFIIVLLLAFFFPGILKMR